MDFRRFNPLCPQKMHYGALFLDSAIAEWSGHTSILVALCNVIDGMLHAASYMSFLVHMWCCMSTPLFYFYRAISILPLLSDSPTYIGVKYGLSLTLSLLETQKLGMFENKELRRILRMCYRNWGVEIHNYIMTASLFYYHNYIWLI
jgi:hypothetical protein